MPYKFSQLSRFGRDVKSFGNDKNAREQIKEAVKAIIKDPTVGGLLGNNLKPLRSYHFGRKPEYRLLYYYYECCNSDQKTETCLFEDEESAIEEKDESVEDTTCLGAIEFVCVASRQVFDNLYHKKGAFKGTQRVTPTAI
jgi:mRNA-degrading endonuclease RelE of RelBE toxin-antitoxin system